MASGLPKVGVEAVIEGIDKFVNDFNKVSSATSGMEGLFNSLGKVAASAGGIIGGFTQELIGLGEIIAGALTANIPLVIKGLIDLTAGFIEGSKSILQFAAALSGALISAFTGVINLALKPFVAAWNAVWDVVKQVLGVFGGLSLFSLVDNIGNGIRGLASAAFDAADDFQKLQVRLEGLLAIQIKDGILDIGKDSVISFGEALRAASGPAEDLFGWLSKFAIKTPFTVDDIAKTFTLATSYGFAADSAKTLTEAVTNFTAGMGLSGEVTERVIQNLGQMVQAGKITGTELRDLARGAFLPVNDILEIMQENLGLTADEYAKLQKQGATDPEAFIGAFIEFANKNFPDAAKRMARTWTGVKSNLVDMVQNLVGMRVIKPALDIVSGTIADFIDIVFPDDVDRPLAFDLFDRIGESVAKMTEIFMGELPSAENLAEAFIGTATRVADALTLITDGDWKAGFTTLGIPDFVTESVENLYQAFVNIRDFWSENGDAISQSISTAFGNIADALLGADGLNPFASLTQGLEDFTAKLSGSEIMMKIEGIGEAIRKAIGWLTGDSFAGLSKSEEVVARAMGQTQQGGLPQIIDEIKAKFDEWYTVANNVWTVIKNIYDTIMLVKDVLDFKDMLTSFPTFDVAGMIADSILGGMGGGDDGGQKGSAKGGALDKLKTLGSDLSTSIFDGFKSGIEENGGSVQEQLSTWSEQVREVFGVLSDDLVGHSIIPDMWVAIQDEFTSSAMATLQTVRDFSSGVVATISSAAATIKSTFGSAGSQAMTGFVNGFIKEWISRKGDLEEVIDEILDLMRDALGIHSPSTVFARMGMQMMQGMALGVQRGVPLIEAAMQAAVGTLPGAVSAPLSGATTNNTVNYNVNMQSTNNYANAAAVQDDLQAILSILRS